MRITAILSVLAAAIAALVFQAGSAQAQTALAGQVSSAEEGMMEGVVVSAKKDKSTITISVVTDAQGRYAFPAARLEPGRYTIAIRAAGYQLDGRAAADVTAGAAAKADLKLKKLRSLSAHLTNAEWMHSMPGTEQQKKFLLNCLGCHTLERIMKSSYDAEGFIDVITRMANYYPGTTPLRPQRLAGGFQRMRDRGNVKPIAEWLATINLSQQDTWQFPLKTLPRPTGKSTKVIFTEYDLPQAHIQPHDVVLDSKGNVWYSDFGQMFLGKMDPKTGKVTQHPIPVTKPGWPLGSLDLEIDRDDNVWLGMMYQAAIVRFDQKTEKFKVWSIPKEWDSAGAQFGHLAVQGTHVDGKVWVKNSNGTKIYRLDLATDKWEDLGAPTDPRTKRRIGTYGIHTDSVNNDAYLLDFSAGNIVKIDAKTRLTTVYLTPSPNSTPRRGRVDAEGRVWFAEYRADRIGMLDPKTAQIVEWKVPTTWSAPYDAVFSKHGHAWTGSMVTDRVARLDIETGEYTEYTLPRPTNIRRVFVDDRSNPGALWIGSNHGGSIVKVETIN
ncbi:MAG: virginiamycin B lyase family protein [Xanthobacteraceae bacterium]